MICTRQVDNGTILNGPAGPRQPVIDGQIKKIIKNTSKRKKATVTQQEPGRYYQLTIIERVRFCNPNLQNMEAMLMAIWTDSGYGHTSP